MSGEDPRPDSPEEPLPEAAEDTEAILSRRRFLIEAAMANAGLAVALSGCPPEPRPCLNIAAPREDVLVPPAPDTAAAAAAADAGAPLDPEPRVCLKIAPPPEHDVLPPEPVPQPCLSVPPQPRPDVVGASGEPDTVPPQPEPRPCLKIAPRPEPPQPPPIEPDVKPEPRPCLKIAPPRDGDERELRDPYED